MKRFLRHITSQTGSSSLLMVLIGSAATLSFMTLRDQTVSDRMKASAFKRVGFEGQEASLYSLTVAKQLFYNPGGMDPDIGFASPVLPPSEAGDLQLKFIDGSSANAKVVDLASNKVLRVVAPHSMTSEENFVNKGNGSGSFASTKDVINVNVRPIAYESFDTGYGVQTVFLEAQVGLDGKGIQRKINSRAKISLNPPQGSCEIRAADGSSPVLDGASLPFGSEVEVNLRCQGVILTARVYSNGDLLHEEGPVTAADDYKKVVAKLLPPLNVSGSGTHFITAQLQLLDGTDGPEPTSLSFTILDPPPPPAPPPVAAAPAAGAPVAAAPVAGAPAAPAAPPVAAGPAAPTVTWEPGPPCGGDPFKNLTLGHWQHLAKSGQKIVGFYCSKNDENPVLYAVNEKTKVKKKLGARDSFGVGCLREGSRILVAPGLEKRIEDLRGGDLVYNSLSRRYVRVIEVRAGSEQGALISVQVGGEVLALTQTHPLVSQRGYLAAFDLRADDTIWWRGSWHSIESMKAINLAGEERVWNLRLEEGKAWQDQLFEANGLLVGDLSMQEEVEQFGSMFWRE